MKMRANRKVKKLSPAQRRCLESLLGRRLAEDEEVTLLTSTAHQTPSNGESPTCYDVARKARVIGMVKDAPPDLSTNKKYLEGLGGK